MELLFFNHTHKISRPLMLMLILVPMLILLLLLLVVVVLRSFLHQPFINVNNAFLKMLQYFYKNGGF